MNKTFADIHLEKKGKASDKWESYLSYYDKIFLPLKQNNISLLEIGIQNGGSLETYLEYFKNAKNIIGCDKKQKCSLLKYSDPKIIVNSQKVLNKKYTMVSSVLIATEDKPEVKIDWRVITKDPDNPLIIDVVIEGVSLAKVQKEEFNSIIQSNDGNINALFENLREFTEKE